MMNLATTTGPLAVAGAPIPAQLRIGSGERAERMRNPGFGQVLTEHMVTARWTEERGWHSVELGPYRALEFSPAAAGIHYGQIVFEGLKSYSLRDGGIGIFRADAAARRLARSARRLAMPEVPESLFTECLRALIGADRDWVPREFGQSLYLRPVLMATEPDLALRPAKEYLFLVLAFVTDNFFPGDLPSLRVWLCEDYVRAAPGGTGEAKCPGNYAASLLAQEQARERGCDQVVWLDAIERRWVEEMGGMNLFFVLGPREAPRLLTPGLSGTILPGVTRDSLLTLGRELGYPVTEERMSVDSWRASCANGTMLEAFACGTAAVVTPIGTVASADGEFTVGDGEAGPVTRRLRRALLDIQHGVTDDANGWITPVD